MVSCISFSINCLCSVLLIEPNLSSSEINWFNIFLFNNSRTMRLVKSIWNTLSASSEVSVGSQNSGFWGSPQAFPALLALLITFCTAQGRAAPLCRACAGHWMCSQLWPLPWVLGGRRQLLPLNLLLPGSTAQQGKDLLFHTWGAEGWVFRGVKLKSCWITVKNEM